MQEKIKKWKDNIANLEKVIEYSREQLAELEKVSEKEVTITPEYLVEKYKPKYYSTLCGSIMQDENFDNGDINYCLSKAHAKRQAAENMLVLLAEELNENWAANWQNANQKKWSPIWNHHTNTLSYAYDYVLQRGVLNFRDNETLTKAYNMPGFEQVWKDYFMKGE